MAKKLFNWGLVAAWMTIIFIFSSYAIAKPNQTGLIDFLVKKTAHLVEFFVLFYLLNRAFTKSQLQRSFLIALAYAFSDETHQLFTPGRGALLRDVVIDALGISLAYFVIKYHLGPWKHTLLPLPPKLAS